jgi:lipooligosaccharide transport system permease protein
MTYIRIGDGRLIRVPPANQNEDEHYRHWIATGVHVGTGGECGGSFLAFIAAGLVAASAKDDASFEVTYNVFIELHFAKLYDAMIAIRVNIEDAAVGERMWATTRATGDGSLFLSITRFFDTPISWWLSPAFFVIVLIGSCFAAIGLAFTATIKVIDVYAYYFTIVLTPSFLFSGIFFPVSERFPRRSPLSPNKPPATGV